MSFSLPCSWHCGFPGHKCSDYGTPSTAPPPSPAAQLWATLSHDERQAARRAFDWNGPYLTVAEHAYSLARKGGRCE